MSRISTEEMPSIEDASVSIGHIVVSNRASTDALPTVRTSFKEALYQFERQEPLTIASTVIPYHACLWLKKLGGNSTNH